MTEPGTDSAHPQHITITLEVLPEDPHNADPALVGAVGRDAVDALRNVGYTVQTVYTGQRGGFLVEVIPFLTTVATDAWSQKDIILGDVSALITILTAVMSIVKHLRKAHEKHVGTNISQQTPIKITLEIDATLIQVEFPEIENAEDILKLAHRIQASHPAVAAKATLQSKVRVKSSVSKRPSRKRR